MEEEEKYRRAKEKVEELKGFYTHLFVYLAVNTGLFILNLVTAPGHWWFYWPLIFWGIGLSSHALSVFGFNKLLGKEWEEKKIEEYMQKYEDKNKE